MTLTEAEKTFFTRAAKSYSERLLAGENKDTALIDACKDVLASDEALWLTALAKNEQGQVIRDALCTTVYNRLNRKAA